MSGSSGDKSGTDFGQEQIGVLLREILEAQQEEALALQGLFTNLTRRIDQMTEQIQAIERRIAKIEQNTMEKDLREQNRKIRTHDVFSFQARKTANP